MAADSGPEALLRGYLNRRLRILLSDGRVVDGNFLCTDRNCNIVIGDCEEFLCRADVDERDARPGPTPRKANIRTLSLAIVPGQHIQSILAASFPTPAGRLDSDKPSGVTSTTASIGEVVKPQEPSLTTEEHIQSNDRTNPPSTD